MRWNGKSFRTMMLAGATILVVSCETIPPGEPPKGAIIPEPELKTPNLNAAMATNHMLTALAMCDPISGAGKNIPLVSNRFVVSKDPVNYLPMDVWNKLIKMKLLRPVSDNSSKAEYRLESEITKMVMGSESPRRTYAWELKLRDVRKGKLVWDEIVKFTIEKN